MAGIAAPIDFDGVRVEQAIQGVAGWRDVAEKALEFVKRFTTITREQREAEEDSDE